jgi:hypothetical protein
MAKSGWYKESARHSLAAKGVPTGRKHRYMLATTDVGKKVLIDPKSVEDVDENEISDFEVSVNAAPFDETFAIYKFSSPSKSGSVAGEWEEGFFTITKVNGAKLTKGEIDTLQDLIEKEHKEDYTE